MTTFILDVLQDLKNKNKELSNLTFVLPSKRAGIFLKHQLSHVVNQTIFSPTIISIEAFVEELSQLKKVPNSDLLFLFYNTYLKLTPKKAIESFDSFSKWAQILIQDFNEIDRYLIPQEKIFNYLSAIKEIENSQHWSLEDNQTEFVKNYLSFWKKLPEYYSHFTDELLLNKIGYQGLIYREAVENLESYIHSLGNKEHVFLGFNALNTAEETIIQEFLQNDLATIYWDIDRTFFDNPIHDAGLFTRAHKNNWTYFKKNPFNWKTDHYSQNKNIQVYGIPKNVGQAKYIGTLLNQIKKKESSFQKTAIVLADENMLIPTLNALPKSVKTLNITMGFPLKYIPLASLFEHLFLIHKKHSHTFYYKDVITLLSHQFIRPLLYNEFDIASKIIETIRQNNLVYLTLDRLKQLSRGFEDVIELLFNNYDNNVTAMLKSSQGLVLKIKSHLNKEKSEHLLALEHLFRFHGLFNELSALNLKYDHIKDINTLHGVFKELLSSKTLDFQGEPLQGLQLMGMLESRVLDFETVIISSVNEGILPSGKTNNSFIPFDVKIENNLPTFKEKDAVYTYHFYRLIQRAKNVYILYNTEADVLTGGEKSRFITQLELEGIHHIEHHIVLPETPTIKRQTKRIQKTNQALKRIEEITRNGFSPSSLTNYIRNPLDFYYQKVLGITQNDDVEENVAANTLGTVIHNTLEEFYEAYLNCFLSVEIIEIMLKKIDKTVQKYFIDEYKEGDITKGKNLIIFEIAKRYVSNFLNQEKANLKQGNTIKVIAIEAHNEVSITINGIDFPVKLTGKVDRVDEYNGVIRIVDYKTGKVEQSKVEVVHWEDITTDYNKYSKSFQVLMYAYMMHKEKKITLPVEAGIISFKNLNDGFLKFSKKDKTGQYAKKESLITKEILEDFENELKKLILEICNPNIDFIEKIV